MSTIFFYGLFMDRSLLVGKGLHPEIVGPAFLSGYRIHIGERATLLQSASRRVYGVVMQLADQEVRTLYSEPSVRDYTPERVQVTLCGTGEAIHAYCYNLPRELGLAGANPAYATELSRLVEALQFDAAYVEEIAAFGSMGEPGHSSDPGVPPMRSQDYSEAEDWPGYFGSVLGKGARETLIAALELFTGEGLHDGLGVDVAAGEGRDTLELLGRGWRVVATDSQPEAFRFLLPRVSQEMRPRLTTVEVDFAKMEIPDCDLVNASFALPFCPPSSFSALWSRIVAAIRPGGRFAGQFFGDRDTWASLPGRTHHSREEILELLKDFDIELMNEEEKDDPPEVRNPKHWQIFHVVAKKR